MADPEVSLPVVSAEHQRIAAGNFERANQVIATGNFDYGMKMLLISCKLDPASLPYRMALRKAQKAKLKGTPPGMLAGLTITPLKGRLRMCKNAGDHLKLLELAEEILTANPWETGTLLDMAETFAELGLLDNAIWTLDQAREKDPGDVNVNRGLARLFEQKGDFRRAIFMWEVVRKAVPTDPEATHKAKDLSARETIQRGQYEDSGEASANARQAAAAAPVERLARETAALLARIKADPTQPGPYITLVQVYKKHSEFEQARALLREGLGLTEQHYTLALELADLELEPFRRHLAQAEEKLKATPAPANSEELRKHRIRLLKEINTRELELFRLRAHHHPTELVHRLELGLRLLRAGTLDEAIAELQQARKDSRLLGRALMYLGYCFKGRNNWRLAQRNFEEALQQIPTTEEQTRKELMFQLASGCAEHGDLAKALDIGHELANIDFTYKDIGRLLDEWEDRLQQA